MSFFDDLSVAIDRVEWKFESHDPFWAWFIVGMYSLAALLCLRALFHSQRALFPDSIRKKSRLFWLLIFVIMLFLACNKQLDLQTYVTAVGREVSRLQGWYDQRRTLQKESIITIGLVAALGLFYLGYIVFHLPTSYKITLVGTLCTFTFIAMRASSFHHFDFFVAHKILGVKLHILVEIVGGVIVSLGAILSVSTLARWERYYSKRFPSVGKDSLVDSAVVFDSDAEPSSELEEEDNQITRRELRRSTASSAPAMPAVALVMRPEVLKNPEVVGTPNIDFAEQSTEIEDLSLYAETVLAHPEALQSEDSPRGSSVEPVSTSTKVDLFQKVSNPKYASINKSAVIDNVSSRVSRDSLLILNRKKRELHNKGKLAGSSEIGYRKNDKDRVDNWMRKQDDNGWM